MTILSTGRVQVEPIPGVEENDGVFDFGAQVVKIMDNNAIIKNRVFGNLYIA
jgi:hypothetical protein